MQLGASQQRFALGVGQLPMADCYMLFHEIKKLAARSKLEPEGPLVAGDSAPSASYEHVAFLSGALIPS